MHSRTALGDEQRQLIKLAPGGGYLLTAEVEDAPDVTADAEAPPVARAGEGKPPAPAVVGPAPARPQRSIFGLNRRAVVAALAGLCALIVGLAVAAPVFGPDLIFKRTPPLIAVIPIVDASDDSRGTAMAAEITGRLTDGFAKIQNIGVVAPRAAVVAGVEHTALPAASPDYEIRGDLAPAVAVALTGHTDDSWRLRSIGEGFQHFMTKPARPDELVALLSDAIDARQA